MAILRVTDLKKTFKGPDGQSLDILDVAHFSLEEGRECALEGSSGCGKSTFLNVVAGLLSPDVGSVFVADRNITLLSEAQRDSWRARNLGYIFQSFHLLPSLSALENVLLGMSIAGTVDEKVARQILDRVGLGERLFHRPHQLSVGQRQRVAVARAVVNRPRLVLADEPTGNLDQRTAGAVLSLIREVCQEVGSALLLVSHDTHVLESFPDVVPFCKINRAVTAA